MCNVSGAHGFNIKSEERETTFVSNYQEVKKKEGSRNRDSTVCTKITSG